MSAALFLRSYLAKIVISALSGSMVKTNKSTPPGVLTAVCDFMKLESAGGILLLAAAIIAMLVANSPLAALYESDSVCQIKYPVC